MNQWAVTLSGTDVTGQGPVESRSVGHRAARRGDARAADLRLRGPEFSAAPGSGRWPGGRDSPEGKLQMTLTRNTGRTPGCSSTQVMAFRSNTLALGFPEAPGEATVAPDSPRPRAHWVRRKHSGCPAPHTHRGCELVLSVPPTSPPPNPTVSPGQLITLRTGPRALLTRGTSEFRGRPGLDPGSK